jgi:nitrite reductase/ring-hydroxylating ferredoxin subunit
LAYNVRTGKTLIPPVGLRIPTYPVEIDGDNIVIMLEWPDEDSA